MNPISSRALFLSDRMAAIDSGNPSPCGSAGHRSYDGQNREGEPVATPRGQADPDDHAALCAALNLPPTATTDDALAAITRLKLDAARARSRAETARAHVAQFARRGTA